MSARFARPVFARIRSLAAAHPDVLEGIAWGHPVFRVGKKTFCAFEIVRGRPSVAFRVAAADAKRLSRKKDFFATPYGRSVWVSRWVDGPLDWTEIGRIVTRSHDHVANASPARTRRAARPAR